MASRARMVNVLRADQAQMGVVGSTLGSNNNSAMPISTAAFAESSEENNVIVQQKQNSQLPLALSMAGMQATNGAMMSNVNPVNIQQAEL